jgi:hypothetical protein
MVTREKYMYLRLSVPFIYVDEYSFKYYAKVEESMLVCHSTYQQDIRSSTRVHKCDDVRGHFIGSTTIYVPLFNLSYYLMVLVVVLLYICPASKK